VWRGLDRKKQGTGIREQGSEKAEHRKKGTSGMGEAEGTGVLRCAQDDSKNKQHQEQKQIPFGMTTKKSNDKEQATARAGTDVTAVRSGSRGSDLRVLWVGISRCRGSDGLESETE
jgi:hypothetical protein